MSRRVVVLRRPPLVDYQLQQRPNFEHVKPWYDAHVQNGRHSSHRTVYRWAAALGVPTFLALVTDGARHRNSVTTASLQSKAPSDRPLDDKETKRLHQTMLGVGGRSR